MSSSPIDAATRATSWVLDASALLALLLREPGADRVRAVLAVPCAMNTVNLSEVVARLTGLGYTESEIRVSLTGLRLEYFDFDYHQAWLTGRLIQATRSYGFSLGDRACLALAQRLDVPALTADHQWDGLDVGVRIVLCR